MGKDGSIVYRMHPGQTHVMQSKSRFKAAVAGTGGGKTAMGPLWCMQQIARVYAEGREPQGLVVAPTYPIMARATAPTLIGMFQGTDFEGIYTPSRNHYDLPGGGRIWTLSADRPVGLEGGQFDFAWVDEGGQLKYSAWIAIQGRLGEHQAPALITTTPYTRNWLYHDFHKRFKEGDTDYFMQQWASNLNPGYPDAEYQRAKRTMSPQRFAMRYNAQFVKLSGLVYPDIESCFVKRENFNPNGPIAHIGGVDFGWSHPFASHAGVIDEDDVLWVYYERYRRGIRIGSHADALPGHVTYYCDPSRPDSINELRKSGHTVRKAPNSIMLGIDAVNARIYSGRLKILETCKAVAAECEYYGWAKPDEMDEGKPTKDEPEGVPDDALDSLRYMIYGNDKGKLAEAA